MITTIIILLGIVTTGIYVLRNRENIVVKNSVDPNDRFSRPKEELNILFLLKAFILFVVFIVVAIVQPYKLERVDAGAVGVKANLSGDERGVSKYTYAMGWNIVNTWSEALYEYSVSQQHIEYDTIPVITKGGFPAKIKPTFNYNLKAANVGDMFTNLRKPLEQLEQGWLMNAIVSSVNDVANRWVVDSIFNYREQFEASIIIECNKRVDKWFQISQLRSNIVPPPTLQAAIVAKTKAIQDAQAEDAKVLTADATGRKLIAQAKADSAFKVITAKGEAEAAYIAANGEARAMKEKQRELTGLYVDYIRAQSWNGALPTTVLGSNSSSLFQLK